MSVPLLAVASTTAPARAMRATGDPATGARFGDALSHAARSLAAGDGDPAAASSVESAEIPVAGLSADASVSSGDDPTSGDECSSKGPDAGTPAPVMMTVMPFPAPPTTPSSGEPRAAADAQDARPLVPAPETAPAAAAGETIALRALAEAPLSPAAAEAPLSPAAAPAVLASAGPAPGARDDAPSVLPPLDGPGADRVAAAVAASSARPGATGGAPVASPTGGVPAAPSPTPGTAPASSTLAPPTVPAVLDAPAAASGTASAAPAASGLDDAAPAGAALPAGAASPAGAALPAGFALPAGAASPAGAAPASPSARHAPSAPATVATTGVDTAAPVPASVPLAPSAPVETAAATATQRSIAAQVAPAVVHIAQRAPGVHQITLTVSPDSTGPVTVRARIGSGGEVRIDLTGATEAGRDALRVMIADLRRDLASVMPHAHLSVGSGPTADTGAGDRGAPGGDGSLADQAGRGREPRPDAAGSSAPARTRPPSAPSVALTGGGLDIVV
ncbi:hypothetical protein [uncultured Microbacterium sp.]|uniref:hypothetical protein n=1 Tax=uncultured Microbacterium sp. TaxID=191216 RepID=UPI00374943FD